MALGAEIVVDSCVSGEKFLGRARALEALHLAFRSTGRMMRILGAIVPPSTMLMAIFYPKVILRWRAAGAIGAQGRQ